MTDPFLPHALILTERTIPQPIFPVAMAGGPERFLRIDFEPGSERSSYVRQVLDQMPSKLSLKGDGTVTCFGRALGFVINFSPDRAVVFNMVGEAVEILSMPHRIGQTELRVKGKLLRTKSILGG